MPRIARVVAVGVPHHITQRGNNRQRVFFKDEDRSRYLELLKRYAAEFDLTVLAYCLMPNHVHLIATPNGEQSLAKAIGRTNLVYTQHVNRVYDRSGRLWQNRFYSCPLDERHLRVALCYVERNPVTAGLVKQAWEYCSSSASAHVTGEDPIGLLDLSQWYDALRTTDWRGELERPQDDVAAEKIRSATSTGRPLGSESFVDELETRLGRPLRAQAIGHPRK